jgi:hypothetical protein
MDTKIIILARKLKTLWDRGDPGERENAAAKLSALLIRHGLMIEDIEEERILQRTFTVSQKDEDIFIIVCGNTIGIERTMHIKGDPNQPGIWYLDLNNSDFIEIEAKFDFFKRAWMEEYYIFMNAFVGRQGLFALDAKASGKEPEEKDYLAAMLAQQMKRHVFHKQLTTWK